MLTKHYGDIAMGLYDISAKRMRKDSAEGKLLTHMMAQLGSMVYEADNEYDMESARLYFESEDFIKHCEVLGLDDVVTKLILTTRPASL